MRVFLQILPKSSQTLPKSPPDFLALAKKVNSRESSHPDSQITHRKSPPPPPRKCCKFNSLEHLQSRENGNPEKSALKKINCSSSVLSKAYSLSTELQSGIWAKKR